VKKALQWVGANVPLMVLALLLAILAWFVAVEAENPARTDEFPLPIPVTVANLGNNLIVVGEFDEEVMVTVRAPASLWNSLQVDDFSATADFTGLGEGIHDVPIRVAVVKNPSQVRLVEPEFVKVELQAAAEAVAPVQVETDGEPQLGYLVRALTTVPDQVVVSGPAEYVAQVEKAYLLLSVQDAESPIEGEFEPKPLDSEGQIVQNVSLTPALVKVRVPIELSGHYRPLAVKAVLSGQISNGYQITNISVEPPSVTVFGAPDIVATLPGIIETEPINVEGAESDVSVRPTLSTPADVTVIPGQSPLEIVVSIEPIQGSRTVGMEPELQGLEPGLSAIVSPETVEVILRGSLPLLESLGSDDVRVTLNLFELGTGTHQVETQVVAPDDVAVQSILPATIQVEIISTAALDADELPSATQ
jgi:YbbR domain-containing protein